MQGETWTEERLDDLSPRIDQGSEGVDRDLRELRMEMCSELGSVRSEISELRSPIYRFGAGLLVAILVSALLQHSL